MDENQLYGAALDRAYRLALLAAGSPHGAAGLIRRLYAIRNPADSETALARGLLSARPLRWPWKPDPSAQSGLTPAELTTLRAALAAATPAARLALGAPHLAGLTLDEALPQPPPPAAPWPRRAADRHTLLALLARGWGMLPAGAPFPDVYELALLLAGALPDAEATTMRAHLLDATPAAAQARAIRDGLRRAEARLAAALPALFAGETPAELRAALATPAHPARPAPSPVTRQRLALVAAVVALAMLVIFMPRPAPGARPLADPAAPPPLPPAALVRAALTRLDAPNGAGVLHERFAANTPGYGWTFERWQELAPPHRFRLEVRDDDDRLRFALASDGAGTLQRRAAPPNGATAEGEDYELEPAALASLLPLLRQQPDSLLMLYQWRGFNLERFYLGQALGAPLRDLGATVAAGRPARTLAFESATPTPPVPDEPLAAPRGEPAQVLLTIDTATYALLEARVLPEGAQGDGEVVVPWHAETYEHLDAAPTGTFTLPPVASPPTSPRNS